jgi:DNA-binding transcriptional ArsR family regulator
MASDEFPAAEDLDLGAIMSALADPLRRRVVEELIQLPADVERTCASFDLPISKSSQTFLFRVLREAGLTFDENYGNRRGVSLRRDDLEARFPGLLGLLEHDAQRSASRSTARASDDSVRRR